tara:strand:+ start:32547 stop:33128 length:582 start_codon:yes stop_codon:yes gene_type:complete
MINEIYFQEFPILKSERLVLRKLGKEDAKEIQLIRSDERVMKYMDSERHTNIEIAKNFVAENLSMYTQKRGMFWALIEISSQKFIGDFSFWKIDSKNSRAEIGYTLNPEFWGKGLMKEAMIKIISFGFNHLKLHSLEANINPENENSRGILTNLGFLKEAYFKENYYFNGEFLDSEIYSLLEPNFKYKTHLNK